MPVTQNHASLIVQGKDRTGIVAAVASVLASYGANIVSLDQYSDDPHGGAFFQRTVVISNHVDAAREVRSFGIPFFHVPSMGPDKSAAESEHLRLLPGNVDFIVLARYMQILSGDG